MTSTAPIPVGFRHPKSKVVHRNPKCWWFRVYSRRDRILTVILANLDNNTPGWRRCQECWPAEDAL